MIKQFDILDLENLLLKRAIDDESDLYEEAEEIAAMEEGFCHLPDYKKEVWIQRIMKDLKEDMENEIEKDMGIFLIPWDLYEEVTESVYETTLSAKRTEGSTNFFFRAEDTDHVYASCNV